jgi:hypothetical protein
MPMAWGSQRHWAADGAAHGAAHGSRSTPAGGRIAPEKPPGRPREARPGIPANTLHPGGTTRIVWVR